MALFNNKPEGSVMVKSGAAGPGSINMVAEGTTVEGTLRAAGDVRISGHVVGVVEVEGKLIVAPEGTVEGEVKAAQADVAGTVRARVQVAERLVLRATAIVEGDVETGRFVVEEGAEYTGQCVMGTLRRTRPGEGDGEAEETGSVVASAAS